MILLEDLDTEFGNSKIMRSTRDGELRKNDVRPVGDDATGFFFLEISVAHPLDAH